MLSIGLVKNLAEVPNRASAEQITAMAEEILGFRELVNTQFEVLKDQVSDQQLVERLHGLSMDNVYYKLIKEIQVRRKMITPKEETPENILQAAVDRLCDNLAPDEAVRVEIRRIITGYTLQELPYDKDDEGPLKAILYHVKKELIESEAHCNAGEAIGLVIEHRVSADGEHTYQLVSGVHEGIEARRRRIINESLSKNPEELEAMVINSHTRGILELKMAGKDQKKTNELLDDRVKTLFERNKEYIGELGEIRKEIKNLAESLVSVDGANTGTFERLAVFENDIRRCAGLHAQQIRDHDKRTLDLAKLCVDLASSDKGLALALETNCRVLEKSIQELYPSSVSEDIRRLDLSLQGVEKHLRLHATKIRKLQTPSTDPNEGSLSALDGLNKLMRITELRVDQHTKDLKAIHKKLETVSDPNDININTYLPANVRCAIQVLKEVPETAITTISGGEIRHSLHWRARTVLQAFISKDGPPVSPSVFAHFANAQPTGDPNRYEACSYCLAKEGELHRPGCTNPDLTTFGTMNVPAEQKEAVDKIITEFSTFNSETVGEDVQIVFSETQAEAIKNWGSPPTKIKTGPEDILEVVQPGTQAEALRNDDKEAEAKSNFNKWTVVCPGNDRVTWNARELANGYLSEQEAREEAKKNRNTAEPRGQLVITPDMDDVAIARTLEDWCMNRSALQCRNFTQSLRKAIDTLWCNAASD